MTNCKTILLVATCFMSGLASAQPKAENQQNKREEIAAKKVAFITQKVELTVEEAQVFWPIYNEHEKAMNTLRRARRADNKKLRENNASLSDKEMEALVDNEIIFKQKELDIQKEFHAKLKSTLPIQKVVKFYRAQEEFKKHLLKELRGSRERNHENHNHERQH